MQGACRNNPGVSLQFFKIDEADMACVVVLGNLLRFFLR